MTEGIVIETTGSWHQIQLKDGREVSARLKGKLRLSEEKVTNPVAVGDHVIVGSTEDDDSIVIQEILPRRNQIIRQSPRKKRHNHIIAANIDQAFIVASQAMPKTKPGFISRVSVALEYYEIEPIILFNKVDLYQQKEFIRLESIQKDIQHIGYKTIVISAKDETGIDEVRLLMKNKISVFTGPSGVGKSTLTNLLNPTLNIKTDEVSNYNEKGKHTTTFSKMHPLPDGGFIIDTPGIKEYALANIDAYELSYYFPEMARLLEDCQFNNCQHLNEPKCAVKQALADGEIASWRYNTYVEIREELLIENKHYL